MSAESEQTIIVATESVSPATIHREFTIPPFGVEHQVRLALEARIEWKNLAGSNPWMRVAINGNYLGKRDLLNKRDEFRLRNGLDMTWSHGDRWRVLYSPDFEQAVKDVNHPHACPDADPYRYVWNITPYVQPGQNRLEIDNLQVLAKPTTLVLRNVKLAVGRPLSPPPEEAVAAAPPGRCPRSSPVVRDSCPWKSALRPAAGSSSRSPAGLQVLDAEQFATRKMAADDNREFGSPIAGGIRRRPDGTLRRTAFAVGCSLRRPRGRGRYARAIPPPR